jgi:hypothetical protein
MPAQQENPGPVSAPTNAASLPASGLFTMICSCLLLGTSLFLLLFVVPHWEETYAGHFGRETPRLTQCIFQLSHAFSQWMYIIPAAIALFAGLISLPLIWRSPVNLIIALCVLAVGLAALGMILAWTILPMTGWL